MTIDLDALEKLADRAEADNPSPWVINPRERTVSGNEPQCVYDAGGSWVANCDSSAADAFIAAANPAIVNALIAELKEARAVIDRLASSEAFDMPQAISGPLAAEIRARMDYARAFLARNEKGER